MRFLFRCPACNTNGIELSRAQRIKIEITDDGMTVTLTCGTCNRVFDKDTLQMLHPSQFNALHRFSEMFM